jgi:hypothetical protein
VLFPVTSLEVSIPAPKSAEAVRKSLLYPSELRGRKALGGILPHCLRKLARETAPRIVVGVVGAHEPRLSQMISESPCARGVSHETLAQYLQGTSGPPLPPSGGTLVC